MIRRLLARLRGPWIADDPNPEPSHPNAPTTPVGEVMPDDALRRLHRDLFRMCDVCSYIPENVDLHVIAHHPNGTHVVADQHDRTHMVLPVRRPVTTVFDQEMPLASEIEAWLASQAGGA